MNQDSTQAAGNQWLDGWLETQRNLLAQWQQSMAQRSLNADLLHQLFTAQMPSAMNSVQGLQTLLQSAWTHMGQSFAATPPDAAALFSQFQPTFAQNFAMGPTREQQTAWQSYVAAANDYQSRQQTVLDAYAKVFTQSLEAARAAAEQRGAQGQPVGLRELYELWIDCGERHFSHLAHEESFIKAQADSANALSRLQMTRNVLLDYWLKSQDMPTRGELNSVHLRLRELSERLTQLERATPKPKRGPKPKTTQQG